MKKIFLMCMFIGCLGFFATSCEKENGDNTVNVVKPIAMDEATRTLVGQMCSSLGVYSMIEPDGVLKYNEMLIIDSQEKLVELAPAFADRINLDGKMILVTPVGLTSGSASVSEQLIRYDSDNNFVWKISVYYPSIGTCDAPTVLVYNMYPFTSEPITLEVIRIDN